ncbi:hypothetical protein GCM10018783_37450 [Streptomyces griseosporeus]|nr:hypothetical protein GCM10018783_37450 [Streptomyces griseosporeus]
MHATEVGGQRRVVLVRRHDHRRTAELTEKDGEIATRSSDPSGILPSDGGGGRGWGISHRGW